MPARTALAALAAAVVMAALACTPAHAEGLSLEDTLCALFQSSPAFQAPGVATRAAQAGYLRSMGAFDPVASASLQGQHMLESSASGIFTDQSYSDLSLLVGVAIRTRVNIGLQLNGSWPLVSSLEPTLSPDQPRLGAAATIPLLKLGSSVGFAAEERASGWDAEAASALQQDAESELTARVVSGYWRWAGAYEQLKVARRLEDLARQQLADVDELIAQRARAAADRLAVAAAAATATANRLQAEQRLFAQQQALWEMLGMAPAAQALPSRELPPIAPAPLDATALALRADQRAASRPLFSALRDAGEAATVRGTAARIAKRPDLSLVSQAGLTRVTSASADMSANAAPQSSLGYFGSVALQFSLPLQNRSARGAFAEATAKQAQLTLAMAQRRAAVTARIASLANDLAALGLSYHERTQATQQFQLAYEAVRTRFRLGTATAMDVVVAEQQYMNASLDAVADRTAYAVVAAQMLHETGVLGGAAHARDVGAITRAAANPTF